ncbi:MAG: PDZ domain-containing protein [Desulfuromonadales bacterium]|nr:PDZ domain-containing protein [Desulfuromonadales bacterium]
MNSSRNFGGVGIDGTPLTDGRIVVNQVVAGGPAAVAGIMAGDIIVQIDGTPTKGSNFKYILNYRLKGKAGTAVTLKIQRPGENKIRTFHLIRHQLILPRK